MGCGVTFDTVTDYVEHGHQRGRVGVGWLPKRSEGPAEESVLSHEEFVGAIPERYLPGEERVEAERGDLDEREVRRVVELVRTCEVSGVVEVMGRLGLPPEMRDQVENVIASC
jgi:hypothetical protein